MTDEDIAKAVHYPQCWDTAAYPTLVSALWEMMGPVRWPDCRTCGKPQGMKE